MNIFYLSHNREEIPSMMVDKHIVKMILETSQILSTAHRFLDGNNNVLSDDRNNILYKATHINHPSTKWARSTTNNYNWTANHLREIAEEYTYRYGKIHKSMRLFDHLKNTPKHIPYGDFTPPPSCMDKQYIISNDTVENYRNYYKYGKSHIHKWTGRNVPIWI